MPIDITALRQQRATTYEAFAAVQAAAEGEGRAMSEEEQASFDRLEAELKAMDDRIRAAERTQAMRAANAIPVPGGGLSETVPATLVEPIEPGIRFAQMTRALIVGQGHVDRAADFAVATWGERHEVSAALQQNSFDGGGALVPERFSAELIDLLRPMTVVRSNARTVPLIGGTDTMPTVEEGTAAYYLGEGDDIQTTEPRFGALKFVEREIAALVPISNKLLRNAAISVDAWLRDEMVRAFAQAEDMHFLRGGASGPGPKGMRYFAPAAHVIPANGTVNLANIETDARKAELALMQAHIPMRDVSWIMPSRVFTFLRDLRNDLGVQVWPSLSTSNPTWKGYRVEVTDQIPWNLGGGADESEVYLVAWPFALIADSYQVRIDANAAASYKSGSQLVSAYSRNQTVIRALAGHDFGMTRPQSVAVLTAVKWGAS